MSATPTQSVLESSLLLNVLFGTVASRAFSEFYSTVNQEHVEDETEGHEPRSQSYYVSRYFVFAAGFGFFVYDWLVLQMLYVQEPYSLHSTYSFFRFATDIIMAYFLFGVVWYASIPRTFDKPRLLIQRVSCWHLMAALWHFLASCEYHRALNMSTILWHTVYVQAMYWLPYIVL